MKIISCAFFVLMCCAFATVQAAPCRSGAAAGRGGQSGYDMDRQAATQTAQNDRSSSDILGKCVSGITAVITAPQFPSLSSIFDQLKNRICQMASDQINSAAYNASSQIYQKIDGINGSMNNADVSQVVGSANMPRAGGVDIQQTSPGTSSAGSFWSNIWR